MRNLSIDGLYRYIYKIRLTNTHPECRRGLELKWTPVKALYELGLN